MKVYQTAKWTERGKKKIEIVFFKKKKRREQTQQKEGNHANRFQQEWGFEREQAQKKV